MQHLHPHKKTTLSGGVNSTSKEDVVFDSTHLLSCFLHQIRVREEVRVREKVCFLKGQSITVINTLLFSFDLLGFLRERKRIQERSTWRDLIHAQSFVLSLHRGIGEVGFVEELQNSFPSSITRDIPDW